MARDRDVAAFDARADGYQSGRLGRMHRDLADRTARLARSRAPEPRHVLDVGCGTGYLLRRLAEQFPAAHTLSGVDLAPRMIRIARSGPTDPRLHFIRAAAEHLPYCDASFDLLISTTSFDHWSDQRAGLAECARVLGPGGQLVLCDLFSIWLYPTLIGSRYTKARTKRRAAALVTAAGLVAPQWHGLGTVLVNAVTAVKATG